VVVNRLAMFRIAGRIVLGRIAGGRLDLGRVNRAGRPAAVTRNSTQGQAECQGDCGGISERSGAEHGNPEKLNSLNV
jgi:hypothetical protein